MSQYNSFLYLYSQKSFVTQVYIYIFSVQLQVEEVTSAMKENINKLFDRGNNLDSLNIRSESLRSASDSFASSAGRLRKTLWLSLIHI